MLLCQPSECDCSAAGVVASRGGGSVWRVGRRQGVRGVRGVAGTGSGSAAELERGSGGGQLLAAVAPQGKGAGGELASEVRGQVRGAERAQAGGRGASAGTAGAAGDGSGRAGRAVGAGEGGIGAAQPGSAEEAVRDAERAAGGRQRAGCGERSRQGGHRQGWWTAARRAAGARRARAGGAIRAGGARGGGGAGCGELPLPGVRAGVPAQRGGDQRADRSRGERVRAADSAAASAGRLRLHGPARGAGSGRDRAAGADAVPSYWKPSAKPRASAAPAIALPTGSTSAKPRAAANSTRTTNTPCP